MNGKIQCSPKTQEMFFGMTSVEFFGHIFDEKGIMMSSTRIQGIQDLPEPTSVKSVRSFMGMAHYFRDLFQISRPISSL